VNGPRGFVHRSPGLAERKFTIRDLSSGQVSVVDEVWLANATFEVSPAGRLRALREHRRTVHAGTFGTLLDRPPRGSPLRRRRPLPALARALLPE
jgi:hypothetical protein